MIRVLDELLGVTPSTAGAVRDHKEPFYTDEGRLRMKDADVPQADNEEILEMYFKGRDVLQSVLRTFTLITV